MFNFSTYLIYVVVTAFTPGPNNIMSMSSAIKFGFKKSLSFILGIFAGFVILMPLCTLFSATLFMYIPKVKTVMTFIGAAYMLYLAFKIWKNSSEIEAKDAKGSSFLSGMLLQFVNPKIYIYAITSMSTYILPVFISPLVLFGFAMLLAFVGLAGCILWALFGAAFCKVLTKYNKIVNAVLALLLVYCAISLFI